MSNEILALTAERYGYVWRVWWTLDAVNGTVDNNIKCSAERFAAKHLDDALAWSESSLTWSGGRIEFCGPAPVTRAEGIQRAKDEIAARRDAFNKGYGVVTAPKVEERPKAALPWLGKRIPDFDEPLPTQRDLEEIETLKDEAIGRTDYDLALRLWHRGAYLKTRKLAPAPAQPAYDSMAQWEAAGCPGGVYKGPSDGTPVTVNAKPAPAQPVDEWPKWQNNHHEIIKHVECGAQTWFHIDGTQGDGRCTYRIDDAKMSKAKALAWLRKNGHQQEADRLEG